MTVLAEPLTRVLGEQAPACTVALDPIDVRPEQFENQLMRRDLIIGPLGFEFPGRIQPVFTDELVCVVARDHPRRVDGGDAVAKRADLLLDGRARRGRLVQPEGQNLAVVVDPDVFGPAEAANRRFDFRGAGRAVHALHVVSQGRPGPRGQLSRSAVSHRRHPVLASHARGSTP